MADQMFCPVCKSADCVDFPVPHPHRAMISDGGIVENALEKCGCNKCGHAFHRKPFKQEQVKRIYGDSYEIGLRDAAADAARAKAYASQILSFMDPGSEGSEGISSLIEFGCGSGALLAHMADLLDVKSAVGIEPSPRLVEAARSVEGSRISIRQGFAESMESPSESYDLCISVNVIEHAHDPLHFLEACKRAIHPDGRILVVCPDGETPGSELLFFDHISSFTIASMNRLAWESGLHLRNTASLTGALQGFRIFLLKRNAAASDNMEDFSGLNAARSDYLHLWKDLKVFAEVKLDGRDYAIFGTGEFADLLNAYCPEIVEKASFFVCDQPLSATVFGKPVLSTARFLAESRLLLVAAVNERSMQFIQAKFKADGIEILHPLGSTQQVTAQ